jgi:predicted tellurium resistance membrane protein TerC
MFKHLYEYGLIIFLMIAMSVLAYQKEANEVVPNQTVVIFAVTTSGYLPIIVAKGLLNKSNEGKKWITLEEYKNKLSRRKSRIDNKHTFEVHK